MTLKILTTLLFLFSGWIAHAQAVNVSANGERPTSVPDSVIHIGSGCGDKVSSHPGSKDSSRIVFFTEDFEDSDFAGRDWYDNTSFIITTSKPFSGTSCAEFHFKKGATTPQSRGSIRHLFDESASVYIRFRIKYSDNWQEQPGGYGHHEFHFLTNKDGHWSGLAFTHLTLYIENHNLEPVVSIQDGRNIDQSKIGSNLAGVTEKRAVAGCNGDSDGLGKDICYERDGLHWNGKIFKTGSKYIERERWHLVEAYFRLNTISDSIGQSDGVIRYWLDGRLLIDHTNAVLRTGKHPDMLFNQFIAAPFLGNGAPDDQTFWIDNLVVGNER